MRSTRMKKQSGFTLIEFSVAMAVTIVVLAATMLAFRDATRGNQNVAFRQDMSDNLRAGLNMIQQDLLQTGTGIPTGGITIPTYTAAGGCTSASSNLNRPLLSGSTKFPLCNLTLAAIEPGNALGPCITAPDATCSVNTDEITILYQDNTSTSSTYVVGMNAQPINSTTCSSGAIASNGSTVTFDSRAACFPLTSLAASGAAITPGDLIMFSNSNGNALQLVTSVSGQTLNFASGDAFGLNQMTSALGGTLPSLRNFSGVDASGNKIFLSSYPPTTATRIWMISYYLDNITDPQHVRLVRRVNYNPGQIVGETLENLQFTYNYNDGITTNQLSVPTGFSESQIRSVNIYLGARSVNKYSQNNKYLRNNFQTQVTLRSMAYVNKYP
jgi:prepilin-type N-terminal cleavage/methylation domain-containing protein